MRRRLCGAALWLLTLVCALAQIDPISRNQVQLGYDQALSGDGPQALYAYYYLSVPEFQRTNLALRLAVAPVYFDGELGIRSVVSPHTDFGIDVYGGGFSENYYEVNQGDYLRDESFDGHGGGTALSLYQLLNPGQLIPLNFVARGGFLYSAYTKTADTADTFTLPDDRVNLFTRVGLRLAGMEPLLYPDIGLEFSVWFERRWRSSTGSYGFDGDRSVNSAVNLYWVYAAFNYAWTNRIEQKIHFAAIAAGSDDADRFSAWRLGGTLPLVSEFPLILPGYYYEEISAQRFASLDAAYAISLDALKRWEVRVEGAGACVDFLPGFEQPNAWQMGVGVGVLYTFPNEILKLGVNYGYGFNALRDGHRGAQSVGFVLQCDFLAWKLKRAQQ